MKLSIVIPVYNEAGTVLELLQRVRAVPLSLEREIILINDGSTDGTQQQLETIKDPLVKIHRLPFNQGKGAAVREGFRLATGDFVILQDADLEYHPQDYPKILQPILDGEADVVYGSRFKGGDSHRVLLFWHSIGNGVLTLLSNMLTNLNLSDMETGFKAFRIDVIKRLTLKENRFGLEPEITAKVAKLKCRIYEVGIAYSGRTYAEGKKITWRDGVSALRCIIKYNLFSD